jgi:hypothetical protein
MNAVVKASSFVSDFKGTCAHCWDSIHHGQMLVQVNVDMGFGLGNRVRNVHANCHDLLIESSGDMSSEFEEDVLPRPFGSYTDDEWAAR